MTRTGHCLCGAVEIRADVKPDLQACHCVQCQRWTGGGPLFSARVSEIEIVKSGDTVTYRASHWGERVTCATCGAILWWKMQGEDITSVAVGLLDDQTGLRIGEEIFVEYRPDWLPPWPDATQSTEAEEFAKLNAYLAGEKS